MFSLTYAISPVRLLTSFISRRILTFNAFSRIKRATVADLWPIWIKEYTIIKVWTDSRAYSRRLSLGTKYIFPVIGHKKPNKVTSEDVVSCLNLAIDNTEHTQQKVLTALSQFLRWCTSKHLLNPSQRLPTDISFIEPHLGIKLRGKVDHYPAIDWREVPRFVAKLVKSKGIGSTALLFCILTTSRSQSVRMAQWDEIDHLHQEWHIPASHMKGKQGQNQPHDVPLSSQAQFLLKTLNPTNSALFTYKGKTISDASLRKCIRRINQATESAGEIGFRDSTQHNRVAVPHGFRAAFMTWAQENEKDLTIVEHCLAHKDSNDKHNGAYRRGAQMKQRRILLQEWADYCTSLLEPPETK